MKDFKKIYLTGDIHGNVYDLWERIDCFEQYGFVSDSINENTPKKLSKIESDDLLIILGDAGFEFDSFYSQDGSLSNEDDERQKEVKFYQIKPTILCIQGNHEVPVKEMHGNRMKKFGANVVESNGIYFVENGEVLTINGKTFLVLGGAYSVDKAYRLKNNFPWWENEEMSLEEMNFVYHKVKGKKFDYILAHTCPYSEMPREMFLRGINQSKITYKTELFLEKIKNSVQYNRLFCGHWHTDKHMEKTSIVFDDILDLDNFKRKEKSDEKDLTDN